MYQFTVPMALVDYIPVAFFGAAAILLLRDLAGKMSTSCFTMFAAGTVDIFAAGFLKATWKLLYAAGVCDFAALNTMFLPVQSLGFLLAGIALVWMMVKKPLPVLAVPPVFSGSVVFISMMVLGLGSICTVLSILAVRLKKKIAAIAFILAFLCSMGMGAMAGQDATLAWVNWVEQGINCVGQGLLFGGTLMLHKAGLKEYTK